MQNSEKQFRLSFIFVDEENGAIKSRYAIFFNTREEMNKYIEAENFNTRSMYIKYCSEIKLKDRYYLSNELNAARLDFASDMYGSDAVYST